MRSHFIAVSLSSEDIDATSVCLQSQYSLLYTTISTPRSTSNRKLNYTMTTSSQQSLTRYLLPFSSLIGVLGLWGGIRGLTNPFAFSETLGVPIASTSDNSNSPVLPFISFAAARNLGSGITMLALCASGNRKATGIFLMARVVTSLADAWICSSFGGESGKAMAHVVLGLLIACWGAALYWTQAWWGWCQANFNAKWLILMDWRPSRAEPLVSFTQPLQ